MNSIPQVTLLRLAEISKLTSLGKSTINLWVAQGKFPAPMLISPTVKVWRLQQLMDWIDKQDTNNLENKISHISSSLGD
jgi:prophage regulatory protein